MFIGLVILGIGVRGVGLGDRVYWVDEVATSIRVAGYTKAQVVAELHDGQVYRPAQLQQFFDLREGTPWEQTVAALIRSPEHTPLYFLLARSWVQVWGSSVVAIRSLSVALSAIALVLMARLANRLYGSVRVAGVAMGLFALSPFFIAYAQEARPYSLWSVTLLWSGLHLLNAMERPTLRHWVWYGLSGLAGLYTSLLTAMVLLGQGIYVLLQGDRQRIQGFGLALMVMVVGFTPWVGIILSHWSLLHSNTEWMRQPMGLLPLIGIWLYSTSVLIFDVPVTVALDGPTLAKILTSTLVVVGMALALRDLCQHTPPAVWQFVLGMTLPTPLVLMTVDLVRNSQLSTAARYLLPFHLGMILAIAFALTRSLTATRPSQRWAGASVSWLLIALCGLSYTFQLQQPPRYQKSRNLHNPAIAALINQAPAPLVVVEPGHTMDLLSLSFDLKPDVQTLVSAELGSAELEGAIAAPTCRPLFLLNPSPAFRAKIQNRTALKEVYRPQRLVSHELALALWQVKLPCSPKSP